MDVKLAYLHGVLEEEIYMEQPESFIAQGEEDKVCRLMHSLYGLKQAGQVWNRTFAHTIKRKLGFNTIHSDMSVYILCCHHKRGDSEMDMILILYVNNLLLLGEDDWRHKTSIGQVVSNEGPQTCLILFGDSYYQRSKHSSHMDRSTGIYWKHTEKVWTPWCKQHKYPSPCWNSFGEIQEPVAHNTKTYYQQITGTLIYAAIGTRPDITFEATRLSQFNNNPTKEHIKYSKYILWYLKGTKELKIKYDGSSDAGLIGYSDSDWGENRDDHHSTSGHFFLMANGAISLASQQQKMVALSVGEAEYMELGSTWQQAAWLISFSREIGFPITGPIPLCSDNQAAIFLTVNPAVKHWTKHINIWQHYIWEQYENKVIEPFHIAESIIQQICSPSACQSSK